MKRQRGFVDPAYLILIALVAIGAALAVPTFSRLWRHEPVSIWGWITGAAGAILMLFGARPFVLWTVRGWIRSLRKPKL